MMIGFHHKHLVTWENQPQKTDRYCPLVMQCFSKCLGFFQVIMANPDDDGQ